MVIDPSNINASASTNTKAKAVHAEREPAAKTDKAAADLASASDSVSLSSEAKSLGKLESAISSAPSFDGDKVNALKSELSAGQYKIDVNVIATGILDQEASF